MKLCKVNKLSPEDAAYIAGFMDGEGSLYGNTLKITQGEHGIQALYWVKEKVGAGSVSLHRAAIGNWQAIYRFQINSYDGRRQLMKQLEPYLKIKKLPD